ncbi:sulfite exporter TauE/SafE family protein [Smaragdicoccus niigatensis]|uniref:sulfite exporter TauE/SafE family protein n=1 Tax=Smaragdicoccus niigatensis TaxID=359359 RepID=UPI00035EE955|nr:sulfite exporter TauE/SafE family protein [Smaragdicoccus niigatensis]
MTDVTTLLAVAFFVGIVVGMTGMGGGALMTPALIFLGIPPTAAVANDLVAAAVNKSTGAIVHWRAGSAHLKLTACLIAGSVPTAFAGAFIIEAFGESAKQQHFVKSAIGCTLILAAGAYAFRALVRMRRAIAGHQVESDHIEIRVVPTVLLGAFGGLIVGVTSVGSGSIIMVLLMVMYPMLSPVRLVGTDLVQAVPLVASAALSHILVSGVDWNILLPLIAGGTPGTFLGARLAGSVSQSMVRRALVIVLVITGVAMLTKSPYVVGGVAIALITLGPIAWAFVRRAHGQKPFQRFGILSPTPEVFDSPAASKSS